MMRVFIIFHDCGHGSFFKSHRANVLVGSILGILVLTPFDQWTHNHAIHHATAGDLDRRGVGDVSTWTVKEYLASSPLKRLGYRIMRYPPFMFTIGAFLVFNVFHRFPGPGSGRRDRQSVILTNLVLAVILVIAHFTIGLKSFFLVHIPVMAFATSAGVWLFYVQHNFPRTYWERHDRWNYFTAALYGSSYYKLPALLQWFTGNIGFHHIHHLNARIPNYLLEKAQKENPIFKQVTPMTPRDSLKCLSYRLWDEDKHRMVGFNGIHNKKGLQTELS
jgi:omega-6 fatty acid desaturase (delta-12 desaturase)